VWQVLDQGLHLVTRFNGSAIKHLIHIGLDDLKVLFLKSLAVTMLKQIQDLKHDIVANLCAREEHC
jgi:hypothetical protein